MLSMLRTYTLSRVAFDQLDASRNRIIAAAIAAIAQLFINSDQCQVLPLRLPGILRQHLFKIRPPRINLRPGLGGAVIAELGCSRSDHLAQRVP